MNYYDQRRSPLITTQGIGSILDFPQDSIMLLGLDQWPFENLLDQHRENFLRKYAIYDARLQGYLSKKMGWEIEFFLMPTEAPPSSSRDSFQDQSLFGPMPFLRFPKWHWCPRCWLLHEVSPMTTKGDKVLFCEGKYSGCRKVDPCASLSFKKGTKRKGPHLVPSRFLVGCKTGHLDDFPYAAFLHQGRPACSAGSGELILASTAGMGLSGLLLKCTQCNAQRFMSDASDREKVAEALGQKCPGTKPWLYPCPPDSDCGEDPVMLQRGRANVYFNFFESAIYVPDKQSQLAEALKYPDNKFWVDELRKDPSNKGGLKFLSQRTKFSEKDLLDHILDSTPTKPTSNDELEFLREEYDIFLDTDHFGGKVQANADQPVDYLAEDVPMAHFESWFATYFERVVLLKKLRETRVFVGFSRISSQAPRVDFFSRKPVSWLPGMEVRGEGIFLCLNQKYLQNWHQQLSAKSLKRAEPLGKPTFLLIHTLAHLLIRQLSFDCGYSATALRERLYVGETQRGSMHGLLIYTASGDSEGTLGGLVRQGLPGRLEHTLKNAILQAEICSNDPLCLESTGQGTGNSNLAACHACALIPETACQERNSFLDRCLAVGDSEGEIRGYFNELLENSL